MSSFFGESLIVTKLPDGGYVVSDVPQYNGITTFLYAASSITEVLNYVRQKMEEKNNG
jgi:hypothetical protein